MQKSSKLLIATSACLGTACAVLLGSYSRDWVEFGSTGTGGNPPAEGRLASLSQDPQVTESQLYYQMVQLLRREFYEGVKDEQVLASGAVRGMIASLMDPDSLFMDKEEYRGFRLTRKGIYEGIGVELAFAFSEDQLARIQSEDIDQDVVTLIPDLVVRAVAPGSPADQAGLKAGDRIDTVNARWIPSTKAILQFRKAQSELEVAKNSDGVRRLRAQFREKTSKSMMPARAKDLLALGTSGEVKVDYQRDGRTLTASLQRRATRLEPVEVGTDGVAKLRFFDDSASRLRERIASGDIAVIDLRRSLGGFEPMKECLAALVPSGAYGSVESKRGTGAKPFRIESAVKSKPAAITLLVDETTTGSAAIFADALQMCGVAVITGVMPLGPRKIIETQELPDGSGYTLVTGVYSPKAPVIATKRGKK